MNCNLLHIVFTVCFVSCSLFGQSENQINESKIKYYNGDLFLLEGSAFTNDAKENRYQRLPNKYHGKVSDLVWDLSKCSSGMSVRFFTNSTCIYAKWSVVNSSIANRNHMAATGVKGVDLYFKNGKEWQYVNTARPNGKDFEELLVANMDGKRREFRLYLPLYIELTDIQIGVEESCKIEKAFQDSGKPIVFYGTSITQGGCASRPGMAHTNIISRKTGIECINLGFRGSGKMEPELAEIIRDIDAKLYVIECLPNMTKQEVLERISLFVEILREKRKSTPVVFVENLIYEKSYLDNKTMQSINEKNLALKGEFEKLKNDGFKNICYIDGRNALGEDHEATVDGTHLTDLGFLRYADFLIQNIKKYKLL